MNTFVQTHLHEHIKMQKKRKKGKRRERKKGRKTIFFHYFEQNAQYRIERSPVISGDLKKLLLCRQFGVQKSFAIARTD